MIGTGIGPENKLANQKVHDVTRTGRHMRPCRGKLVSKGLHIAFVIRPGLTPGCESDQLCRVLVHAGKET